MQTSSKEKYAKHRLKIKGVPLAVSDFHFVNGSMPFLTVDALIGNQAFQNGWMMPYLH